MLNLQIHLTDNRPDRVIFDGEELDVLYHVHKYHHPATQKLKRLTRLTFFEPPPEQLKQDLINAGVEVIIEAAPEEIE